MKIENLEDGENLYYQNRNAWNIFKDCEENATDLGLSEFSPEWTAEVVTQTNNELDARRF